MKETEESSVGPGGRGGAPSGRRATGPARREDATGRGASNLVKMLAGHFGSLLLLTISGFVIPRFLGAEVYGQYAAALAVVVLLQAVSSLGLQQVEMRYLAPLWTSGEERGAVELASTLWLARLLLAALAGGATVLWLSLSEGLGLGRGLVLAIGLFCFLRSLFEATKSLLLPLGHVGKLSSLELARAGLTLPVVILAHGIAGLEGVFLALLPLYGLLIGVGVGFLLRILPLGPRALRWSALRPYVGYSAQTFVSTTANNFYSQFSIYATAMWASRSEGAFVAIVVRFYALARGLLLASRRALMPIMAEIEEAGRPDRLRYWGDVMMRYGVAGATAAALTWVLLGRDLVRWVLTDAFAVVYPAGTVMAVAVVAFSCAAAATGLLFVRGRADLVAANALLYAGAAALGLWLAVRGGGPGVVVSIAWVYAWTSALHALLAYLSLGLWSRVWLPLGRALLLMTPLALVPPLAGWEGSLSSRAALLLAFLVGYACLAVGLHLLPLRELAAIRDAVVGRREPEATSD